MILGPVLSWLLLPFLAFLLVLFQGNQENRPDLFRSSPAKDSYDFDRKGRLGHLIRLAYLRTFGDPTPYPGRKLSLLESRYAAKRIHGIYNRLLKLSAEVDYGFHPALTPEEILQALRHLFPELKEDLTTINESHARILFGELPKRQHDLDIVERSWLRVQAFAEDKWREPSFRDWCHDQTGCTCS